MSEPERQLGYAALQRLLLPYMGRVSRLPDPQRDALLTVLGMVTGPTPEVFHVGLAVLSLLSDLASDVPLFCVVDDAQWLDRESLDVIAFICRRLVADPIGVVLSFREPADGLDEFDDSRVLRMLGLPAAEALRLLETNVAGFLSADVGRRILDETVWESVGDPRGGERIDR